LAEELDDELRLRVEPETEKNLRAGMDLAEARRRALVATSRPAHRINHPNTTIVVRGSGVRRVVFK
jgi:hypothetical protein